MKKCKNIFGNFWCKKRIFYKFSVAKDSQKIVIYVVFDEKWLKKVVFGHFLSKKANL